MILKCVTFAFLKTIDYSMKIKNLLFTLILAMLSFAGCEMLAGLGELIQVGETEFEFGAEGGEDTFTLVALDSWDISVDEDWLEVDPYYGEAALEPVEITITVGENRTDRNRTAVITVAVGDAERLLTVTQAAGKGDDPTDDPSDDPSEPSVVEMPIAEVYNLENGAEVIVKGTVVARYERGFMISDGVDNLLIFEGYESAGTAIGSQVTVQAVKTVYNGQAQLQNPTSIEVTGKVNVTYPEPKVYTQENMSELIGGTVPVYIRYTGDVGFVTIKSSTTDKTWREYDFRFLDNLKARIRYPEPWVNEALDDIGGESVTVTGYFIGSSKASYTDLGEVSLINTMAVDVVQNVVEQPDEPVRATVAEFISAPVGDGKYILTGTVTNLVNSTYGNFTLVDETGSVFVYGLTATQVASNDKSFKTLGIEAGDIVTLVGTRTEHGGVPEVGGPAYYVSHVKGEKPSVIEMSIPEIRNQADGTEVIVKGTVVARYSRGFMLSDGVENILIYEGFESIGTAIGSQVTVRAVKAVYNRQAQLQEPSSIEVTGKVNVTYPEPKVYTLENAAELWDVKDPVYIQYTAPLSFVRMTNSSAGLQWIEHRFKFGDNVSGQIKYSEQWIIDELADLGGRSITVTGYFIGPSKATYADVGEVSFINTMAVDVKLVVQE